MSYPTRYGLRTDVIYVSMFVNPTLPKNTINKLGLSFSSKWMHKPELLDTRNTEDFHPESTDRKHIFIKKEIKTYRCLTEVTVAGLYQEHRTTASCKWEEIKTTCELWDKPKWSWDWTKYTKVSTNGYHLKTEKVYPNFGVLKPDLLTKLNTPDPNSQED